MEKKNTTYVFFCYTEAAAVAAAPFLHKTCCSSGGKSIFCINFLLLFFEKKIIETRIHNEEQIEKKKCMRILKCARAMNQRRTFDLINDCSFPQPYIHECSTCYFFWQPPVSSDVKSQQQQQLVIMSSLEIMEMTRFFFL